MKIEGELIGDRSDVRSERLCWLLCINLTDFVGVLEMECRLSLLVPY